MTAFMFLIPNASPALVERLGWTLVHFLWQGALIGLLSASLLAALHGARAHTRYLLACGSLLTLLAAPIFTFLLLAPQPLDATANLATSADTATIASRDFGMNGVVAALATYARLVVGDTVASHANSVSTNDATRRDSEATRPDSEARRRESEAMRRHSEAMLRAGEAVGRDSEAIRRGGEAMQLGGEAIQRGGEPMLRGGDAGEMYRRALAAIDGALPWLVQAWTLGICLLSLRLAGGLALVVRWKRRRLQPASLELQQRLVALAQRLGVRRAIALRIAPGADTPAVIGWLRPVVLLPASALIGLAPAQLEAVLAHELAHVRRHDYLVNLLQSIAETLLFYHPAVWYVSHQIRVEREYCCDDDAIASCGDAVTYASALADLETLRHGVPAFAMTAVGSGRGRTSLLHRIRRLLTPASPSASPASAWPTNAALLAMTIVVLSAFALRSSLAAAPRQQPPAPPPTPPSTAPSHGVDDLDIELQAPPAVPAPPAPAAPPEPIAAAPKLATPAPPILPGLPEPPTPTSRASRPASAVPSAPAAAPEPGADAPELATPAPSTVPELQEPAWRVPMPRAITHVALAPPVATTPGAPATPSTVTAQPARRAPRAIAAVPLAPASPMSSATIAPLPPAKAPHVTTAVPPAPAMPMSLATIAPLPPAAVAPGANSPVSRAPAAPVPPAAITPLPSAMAPRVTTIVPAAPAVAVTPAMAEPQPPAAPAPPAAPSEPPAPPVPPGNSGFRQEESSHDSTFTMQSNDDTTSLRVRGRGRIEFTDDDADVKSLSDGGYLEIEERTPGGTARVEFTSRAGSGGSTGGAGSPGGVERRWWKDGRSESFEPEGRAWVAKRLPDIIRRTGLAADTRVARILQREGPNGVLDEVSRIPSDFVKSRYLLKLLAPQAQWPSQKPLDTPVLTRLIVQTGREIKSDFARGQVLGAVAKLGVPPDDVAVAYIDATRTMHSDFERGRALGALVQAARLHTATLKVLLDSATTIKSNFELSRLMLTTLEHQQLDETSLRAYLGAEGSIQSDFERRRVLTALTDARAGTSKPLPESTIRGILEAVSHMHSAFDASQVLTSVAGTQRLEGDLRKQYIDTADKLSSRFERDRALAALAHNEHAERD